MYECRLDEFLFARVIQRRTVLYQAVTATATLPPPGMKRLKGVNILGVGFGTSRRVSASDCLYLATKSEYCVDILFLPLFVLLPALTLTLGFGASMNGESFTIIQINMRCYLRSDLLITYID